ncbi:MAG: hypothetical protein K8R90_11455 [Candidatus Cloacimonetes bacterium]|nr:hypothetical protein [Candidatus Cloacimonadota bacterium]
MLWFAVGLLLLIAELFWRHYFCMSLGTGALVAGISLEYIQRAEWQALIMFATSIIVFFIMRKVNKKWINRGDEPEIDDLNQPQHGGNHV